MIVFLQKSRGRPSLLTTIKAPGNRHAGAPFRKKLAMSPLPVEIELSSCPKVKRLT
jgi:hypothetical protein